MKGISRSKTAKRIVPHGTVVPSASPGAVLSAVAKLGNAALVRHQGRWIVTAAPTQSMMGDAAWDALRQPISVGGSGSLAGGWIGLVGYDAGAALEGIAASADDVGGPPAIWLGKYDAVVAIDDAGQTTVEHVDADARDRLFSALGDITPLPEVPPPYGELPVSSLPKAAYEAVVRDVRELIRAGDCYQVNIAQRLVAKWDGGPLAFAAALWRAAPAQYRAYLDLPGGTLVSSSPELLVRTEVSGDRIIAMSSPIKGTTPPGEGERLAHSAKDLAEHVMIVDLIRNDLGRVATAGGVSVPRMKYPLSTPYADHLVSDVQGELRPGVSPADVLRALAPGGSVTGCPKIRAMEVIRDLEPAPRGPAFGSVVAIGPDGHLDASILIRTAWLTGHEVRYWCGGAVVWDSDPEAEWREAGLKAAPFLTALGVPST
jgi:anthranilate/para-aminobenzoate synthase component I